MLSKKEREILFQLDINSRKSASDIAKSTGTKVGEVEDTIKKLQTEKILENCFPMIEFRGLGYFFGILLIKLKRKSSKLYDELKKSKNNTIILELEGEYDAYVAISIKGLNRLNNFLQQFNKKYRKYIHHYDCAVANGFFRFYRSYLIDTVKLNPKREITGRDLKVFSSDPIDLRILSLLNLDCRKHTDQKIASIMEMPVEQVEQRIAYLERESIIQCYTLLLNHKLAGIARYRILFKVSGFDKNTEKKFIEYCNSHKHIIHYLRLFGSWDFLIEIEFLKKTIDLKTMLLNIKRHFGKYIIKISVLRIKKIYIYKDVVLYIK